MSTPGFIIHSPETKTSFNIELLQDKNNRL